MSLGGSNALFLLQQKYRVKWNCEIANESNINGRIPVV